MNAKPWTHCRYGGSALHVSFLFWKCSKAKWTKFCLRSALFSNHQRHQLLQWFWRDCQRTRSHLCRPARSTAKTFKPKPVLHKPLPCTHSLDWRGRHERMAEGNLFMKFWLNKPLKFQPNTSQNEKGQRHKLFHWLLQITKPLMLEWEKWWNTTLPVLTWPINTGF